jgi:hypothetical protein
MEVRLDTAFGRTAHEERRCRRRVQFAGGQRVSGLKPVGRHGYDVRYQATVTSKSALRIDAKDTVRIKLPGSPTVVRLVKLHPAAA